MDNEPKYEILRGIRAVRVEGAEQLVRQGEYYSTFAGGHYGLVINCPNCRATNLTPPNVKFKTSNWFQRLLGIRKGLTIDQTVVCYVCQYGFRVANAEISVSNERIPAKA